MAYTVNEIVGAKGQTIRSTRLFELTKQLGKESFQYTTAE